MGVIRAFKQSVVQLVEAVHILRFPAKHLDHLLAFDHLLNIAVYRAQILLLSHEMGGGFAHQLAGGQYGQRHHQQRKAGEGQAQGDHGRQHADDGDGGGNQLGHTLADHLPQSVDVVGIDAHDIAVGMGVKIAQRQAFHMAEQVAAQVPQRSLGDGNHQLVLNQHRNHAAEKDQRHQPQLTQQRGEIRRGLV